MTTAWSIPFCWSIVLPVFPSPPPSAAPPPPRLYLVGANCCYRGDAVLDGGGFDEDIPRPGGEDIGLSVKLSRAGWEFGVVGGAIVYHDYRIDILDFLRT